MASIYLALGSNLGNRKAYIQKAIEELKNAGLIMRIVSTIIETDPQDAPAQDKFLNAVLKAETNLSPEELIILTQNVEDKLGRVRKIFRGPRVIDVDILLYDDIKLVSPKLIIPHPRLLERSFVMQPLMEIDPVLCRSLKP